jgi:hypothetical protein
MNQENNNVELRNFMQFNARHQHVVCHGVLSPDVDQEEAKRCWSLCCRRFDLEYTIAFQRNLQLTPEQLQILALDFDEPFGVGLVNPEPGILMAIGWGQLGTSPEEMEARKALGLADTDEKLFLVAIGAKCSNTEIQRRVLDEKAAKTLIANISMTRLAMEQQLSVN